LAGLKAGLHFYHSEKGFFEMDDQRSVNLQNQPGDFKRYNEDLLGIVKGIFDAWNELDLLSHMKDEAMPSMDSVIESLNLLRRILFPGYFSKGKIDPLIIQNNIGRSVFSLFNKLSEQICHSIRYDRIVKNQPGPNCQTEGYTLTLAFLESIPDIQKLLVTDIVATYGGDPAAKSYDEIIYCYPGIYAITVYRLAHKLFQMGVPLLPRMMTEYAHSVTGIDIHPGARIDESFVIDHGTGIVIGETTEIGKNVRIYQGVTLGALSVPKDAADSMRWKKRHPTIEDNVIIYSGATILGGEAVIGARSIIGGNVWITESVPPDTKVMLEKPNLVFA
jgi:serine O-acetyltransferase